MQEVALKRRKIKLFILRNAVYLGYLAQQVHMRIIFYFKLNYISIFAKKTGDYGGSTKWMIPYYRVAVYFCPIPYPAQECWLNLKVQEGQTVYTLER